MAAQLLQEDKQWLLSYSFIYTLLINIAVMQTEQEYHYDFSYSMSFEGAKGLS